LGLDFVLVWNFKVPPHLCFLSPRGEDGGEGLSSDIDKEKEIGGINMTGKEKLVGLVSLVGLILCFSAQASLSAIPDTPDTNAWITDGPVYAIVTDPVNQITYIGGGFTQVGPRTGYGVPINASTGSPESSYPQVNGKIYTVIPDGSGGRYIG